jgi:hypothetical protein
MADTARNQAALLTLMPDNTNGAISPQDLRDFVVSAQLHGATCWEDVQGDAFNADKKDGLTLETYRDTDHQCYFFNHDAVNTLSLKFQMPHRYSTGSVRVHTHTIPCATAAGNVVFKTLWAWERNGYTMPSTSGWSSKTSTMAVYASNVYKEKYHHLATCAVATGCGASSILWVTVKRVATATTDTYTASKAGAGFDASANLAVSYIDVHYPVKRAGTESET